MAATWGITTTTNASPADILRFTKHYAALGATQIDIYLDEPPDSLESLKEAPAVSNFIMCTNKYWHDIKGSRPENLVSRQIANATRSYRMARFGWLGHVDTDELIMCNPPFGSHLHKVPKSINEIRVRTVERLCDHPDTLGSGYEYFKLPIRKTAEHPGQVKEVYPEYGYLLSSGFISHTRGKVFVRSGLQDLRLGVHKARGVKTRSLELTDCYLAHYHVRDVSEFLDRLHDRIYGGSYGRSSDLDPTSLRAGLEELMRKEGSDGLRKFFLTTCTANNQLLLRLSQKGLLLRRKVH